jgi:hypothetical protein
VGLEEVEPAVAVEVGDPQAHAGLLVAELAVRDAARHGHVGEGAVPVVAE